MLYLTKKHSGLSKKSRRSLKRTQFLNHVCQCVVNHPLKGAILDLLSGNHFLLTSMTSPIILSVCLHAIIQMTPLQRIALCLIHFLKLVLTPTALLDLNPVQTLFFVHISLRDRAPLNPTNVSRFQIIKFSIFRPTLITLTIPQVRSVYSAHTSCNIS